jgi:predicted HAD superfamily Cof-like phosphohydrolase
MTSTPHTSCTHPATSSARAKCRKGRAAHALALATQVDELITSYYDGTGDAEEIAMSLAHIFPQVHEAYYDLSLDIEEVIALARRA